MNRGSRSRPAAAALVTIAVSCLAPGLARAEECQNQWIIDSCTALCSATEGACGGLCDLAGGACMLGCDAAFGTCDAGCVLCDVGCEACCCDICVICSCGDCRDDCDDCRDECDGARSSCEAGCRLDCDDCLLECRSECESICIPFRKLGESCVPLVDRCGPGLVCVLSPEDLLPRCFPDDEADLVDDDVCRALYSPTMHAAAMATGNATSYGAGAASAVGVSTSLEIGGVFSPDGRFGCYTTTCIGGTTDVEVGGYASLGLYLTYEDFRGQSIAFIEEAGEGLAFVTGQILNTTGDLIGTIDCLSIELSLSPIAVGVYECTTIVDTVGMRNPDGTLDPVYNSRPLAQCAEVEVCADADTCVADADVDGGSVDPDEDTLRFVQDPPGPYELGEHQVTLTVLDPDDAADSCVARVTVIDCSPPVIACPEPLVVQCEEGGEAVADPGLATVEDCSNVVVDQAGEGVYPLGSTTVVYRATDASGWYTTCTTTVEVEDVDSDGDGVVDCVDRCPSIPSPDPTGCAILFVPRPLDSDGDGVANGLDVCPDTPEGQVVDHRGCAREALPDTPPQPADEDQDGVPDDRDVCPDSDAAAEVDDDGCPIEQQPVVPPPDSDGDGVDDDQDLCPDTPPGSTVDADGCLPPEPVMQPEPDEDGDGVPDADDLCPGSRRPSAVDLDGCPIEDPAGQFAQDEPQGLSDFCGTLGPMSAATLLLGLGFLALGRGRRRP